MLLLCSCVIVMIHYTHSQGKYIQLVNSQSGPPKCGHPHNQATLKNKQPPQQSGQFRLVPDSHARVCIWGGGGGGRKGREIITYHCRAVVHGDMWASQLLTLQTTNVFRREITSEVTDVVARVEFVIFNCPE